MYLSRRRKTTANCTYFLQQFLKTFTGITKIARELQRESQLHSRCKKEERQPDRQTEKNT